VEWEIIYGGISELQDRSVGSLTYELTGAAADVETALAQLGAHGVAVSQESVA
jgi:D-methionine transport system ATP-binding protein